MAQRLPQLAHSRILLAVSLLVVSALGLFIFIQSPPSFISSLPLLHQEAVPTPSPSHTPFSIPSLPLQDGAANASLEPLHAGPAGDSYYFAGEKTYHLPVAPYNQPPTTRPRTPLFIGFTQNYAILQQALVGYIAAGWPPEDIIVIDNSGVMDANARNQLTKDNPFYLDYEHVRKLGVSILQTPVLLTFAQLQNFYLRTAIGQDWKMYFWSHMDVLVIGDEHVLPYRSFYDRIVEVVEKLEQRTNGWALRWFAYDQLTLMSVDGWRKIGQWDPFIPYYHSDCDAYSRAGLHGLLGQGSDATAGGIYDIAGILDGYETRLFPGQDEQGPNSTRYQEVRQEMEDMQKSKRDNPEHRRPWQDNLSGGAGQPFTYDPKAFRHAWLQISEQGEKVYKKKWGTMECHMDTNGGRLKQMWAGLELDKSS